MKIFKTLLLFGVFFLLISVRTVQAADCESDYSCESNDPGYEQCLRDKKECLENQLEETRQKKTTLESAIGIINGNINIQQIKISQTKNDISTLENEIDQLSNRISGLSISLDRLSTLLVERIRTQYKREHVSPLSLLASSKSLSGFLSQYKYLQLAGKQTADAMQKADNQRTIYNEQIKLKEIKQAEVESKRVELQQEQNVLVNQRQEQQNLLEVTKNDEEKFQDLLEEAQREITALKSYTSSKGGSGLVGNITECDDWGCYYNQRDSAWGSETIGNSNETLANVGCLVSSIAMITSHYGKTLTPSQIAASSNPFFYNTANMLWQWSGPVQGISATRTRVGYNVAALDAELATGRPAIVRITASNSVGTHFLVVTEKKDGKYIMKDPYEADGNDIPFTDKHSLSQITAVDRVTVY